VHSKPDPRPGDVTDPGRDSISIEAPAKVNLCLEILGRRADGFHELDTVMQTVDLCDTLSLTRSNDGHLELTVTGRCEGVPSDESNLVMRAAGRLQAMANGTGARMSLLKRIPNGAGLGGGSSDAAAALVGLRDLWAVDVPDTELARICADLGSDVPFFLRGGTARCRGSGELITAVESTGSAHLVLVFSPPLATRDVYQRFADNNNETSTCRACCDIFSRTENGGLDLANVGAWCLHNALEDAAIELEPSLAGVRRALIDAGAARACMSGSGSCFFGIAGSRDHAERVARALRDAGHEAVTASTTGARPIGA